MHGGQKMCKRFFLSVCVAVLFSSTSAIAEAGDIRCEFQNYSGFRSDFLTSERLNSFGVGFVANPRKSYVRKLGPQNKIGRKEKVDVLKKENFII